MTIRNHEEISKMDRLLNISQFAELLGVSRACVRRWVLERKVTIVKVGRLVRIPSTEFDRIVSNGTRTARQSD